MNLHTQQCVSSADKYLLRHFLEPGIMGLAQVKGCRGHIIQKSYIVNRVRYDIFYMEKYSLKLDLPRIYDTVINCFKSQGWAY